LVMCAMTSFVYVSE